jgi:Transglutaminase-like superfamily
MPRAIATLILLSLPVLGRADEPKYFLETKDVQKVVAKLPYGVTCPKIQATEWAVVMPQLPELPGQTKVKTTLAAVPPGPTAVLLKDRNALARPMLALRIPAKTPELKTSMNVLVTYEATLRSRALTKLDPNSLDLNIEVPKVVELSAADRKKALAATTKLDFETPVFKKWLTDQKLIREPKETDIDFARRSFEALKDVKFILGAQLDRKASAVALAKKSDDSGMANLYVAVLRANKVPARILYGRWTEPAVKAKNYQWHTSSEFYADGVGWVPVDPSRAIRRYGEVGGAGYFGHDGGDFLVFHVDPDIMVDVPGQGVKTLEIMQLPAWFARGEGSGEGVQFREDWTIEKLP